MWIPFAPGQPKNATGQTLGLVLRVHEPLPSLHPLHAGPEILRRLYQLELDLSTRLQIVESQNGLGWERLSYAHSNSNSNSKGHLPPS